VAYCVMCLIISGRRCLLNCGNTYQCFVFCCSWYIRMSWDSLVSQIIDCGLDQWNPFSGRDRVCVVDMFRVIRAHLAWLVLGRPECEGDC
jgi:hypothetical protein